MYLIATLLYVPICSSFASTSPDIVTIFATSAACYLILVPLQLVRISGFIIFFVPLSLWPSRSPPDIWWIDGWQLTNRPKLWPIVREDDVCIC